MEEKSDSPNVLKTVITCEPTIDINYASTLYEHLKAALEEKREVEIHAGEVTKVDTAILQVFLAFSLEAKNVGITVNWMSVSETFLAAAELLGLTTEMELLHAA
jgi:anti-anti-sigma regulatory factor